MSTYTAFEATLLVGVYLVSEESGKTIVEVKEVIERYRLQPKPHWILRALQEYEDGGLSKRLLTHDDPLEQSVWLTAIGAKEAERLLNENVVSIKALEDDTVPENELREQAENLSAAWTGRYDVSESGKVEVVHILKRISSEVDASSLSNSDKFNAKALLEGAEKMIEAPDPEWSIILQILSSPILANFAALAALAIAIIKP